MRKSVVQRKTNETDIYISLNIDGTGKTNIKTGIGFLDHMLTLFGFHGEFDLEIKCSGDLEVDTHHSAEDIGIALGQAFKDAIKDKVGIERYGTCFLPMDESLARLVLDFSGRPYLVYDVDLKREYINNMASEDFKEFFRGFVNTSLVTLHIDVIYGENDHHKIEAVFKGFGRVVKTALKISSDKVKSTKGVL